MFRGVIPAGGANNKSNSAPAVAAAAPDARVRHSRHDDGALYWVRGRLVVPSGVGGGGDCVSRLSSRVEWRAAGVFPERSKTNRHSDERTETGSDQ